MKSEKPTSAASPQAFFNQPEPVFGFSAYAEQINGRFAMIGFVGLLVLEFLTGQGLLTWLGLLNK
jgi:hypothetical protein